MKRQFTFYKYLQFMPNRWRVVEEIPYPPEGEVLRMYKEKIIKRFWFKKNAESYCFQLQLETSND